MALTGLFHHGTQKPVHTLAVPYLDPNKSCGRDIGDPTVPHVFLTHCPIYAALFSCKTEEAMMSGFLGDQNEIPYQIYYAPPNIGDAYIYCIDGAQQPDLHELIIDGMRTSKYVTYQPVDVSAGPDKILTGGLNGLMSEYGAQVFVLHDSSHCSAFFKAWRACNPANTSDLMMLLHAWRDNGQLHHLNQERDIRAHSLVM